MAADSTARVWKVIAAVLVLGGCGDAASDGGIADGGNAADGGAHDAGYEPPVVMPPEPDAGVEFWLSETGLYRDIAHKVLAPDLIAFEPTYKLWSDGADKRRWLRLPEGKRIDTREMDHWIFPVGTMVWKEFSLDGKRLETRLIMRTGRGPHDFFMGAFAWNDDESDARFVPMGAQDVRGTDHDLPESKQCLLCHDGEPGRILGFSAVQQPDVAEALLTVAPTHPFVVPGDEISARALGYLHANCGHCHNENGTSWPDTDMDLRLLVADERVEDTATYRSTRGVALQYFEGSDLSLRVKPGDPTQSGLYYRMSMRGPKTQMPPLATEHVDDEGTAAVRAWIERL